MECLICGSQCSHESMIKIEVTWRLDHIHTQFLFCVLFYVRVGGGDFRLSYRDQSSLEVLPACGLGAGLGFAVALVLAVFAKVIYGIR